MLTRMSAIRFPLFLVLSLTAALLVQHPVGAANPPNLGDVLINEYVANATTEWVELYNTTGTELDISGHYIDDISGGGSPLIIPANTTIAANGYYVHTASGLFNNGGDEVRFLAPNQSVLDSISYGSATADHSFYRYPDGGNWSNYQSPAPSQGATNSGTGDQPWEAGNFEIRIFDVEQGDSQLIIFPSGFTILIDVREASWNTGAGAAYIAQKIQAITGGTHIDVGVLSHHHLDHIGYAGYGGFWGLIENEGITFDQIIDRDGGEWVDGSGGGTTDGLCDPDLEIVWNNAGTQSGTARNWLCYATDSANTNIYGIREIAQIGSTTQIDPPDTGAVVEIIHSDGAYAFLSDGVTSLQGDHTWRATPPSENDYSIALKIRYGLIDYATAGDSDGEYDTSTFGYTYNDVETALADLYGPVDVLRANHHGSGHSSSEYYVDTLDPLTSFISCGENTFGHPAQTVLDRLLATGDVYLTNLCDETRDYGASVIVEGDIILISTDGENYTVNGESYVATDPPPPPTVADVVINELYANADTGQTEWIELYNPTAYAIDLSGAWIDDVASGGGSPIQIPASTSIAAGGHWTMNTNNFFNNSGGDYARLLLPDGTTLVDSYYYTTSTKNKSWYRSPDGGAWAGSQTTTVTKGATNP